MEIKILRGPFESSLHGGQYAATGPSGPFPAWCAEQTQYLSFGEVIDYTIVDGVSAWGTPISEALDRLMSWSAGSGWPTTLDQNDAIQNDIWTILAGQPGKIDTTATPITQHASLLHNDYRQDLLAVIGEPDPAALLVLGLAAIMVSRRALK